MVLLCKSYKNGVFGHIPRVPPQQSIENARHFMPCTECMSVNCMRRAQAACSMHALQGDSTPPMRIAPRASAAGLFALRVTRRGPLDARRLTGIRGEEDLEDFEIEKLPRAAPEATRRGLGGPEIHLGATKVKWLITRSGPRVTQQRPRAPQDCFKSVQEDPMRG